MYSGNSSCLYYTWSCISLHLCLCIFYFFITVSVTSHLVLMKCVLLQPLLYLHLYLLKLYIPSSLFTYIFHHCRCLWHSTLSQWRCMYCSNPYYLYLYMRWWLHRHQLWNTYVFYLNLVFTYGKRWGQGCCSELEKISNVVTKIYIFK